MAWAGPTLINACLDSGTL